MSHSEEYLQKLKEFEPLIWYASRRYQIPGVLDPEDLYQEGCIILDDMFRKYDFDPNSCDFRKMFKTELWHGLSHVLYKYKTKKRDFRKTARGDIGQLEEEGKATLWQNGTHVNPEEAYEAREVDEKVSEFVSRLSSRLDKEACQVLGEMLNPRSWEEIPDYAKVTGTQDEYWRVPSKIPQHVLAHMLGWPLIRVRRAIARIRKQSVIVGAELDIQGIDLIKPKKRRRRNAEAS